MNTEYDFSKEFTNDTDVENALSDIMASVARAVQTEDNRAQVTNPAIFQNLAFVYKVMRYLVKGTSAKVTYKLNEPYKSMGSVTVLCKNIKFNKPDWLIKAIGLSSNFEVYPKTDGTVEMNFTFHNLTIPIE